MAIIHEGRFSGKNKRIGIVVSRFNDLVTSRLLESALNFLRRSNVSESDLEVAWVPGAFEIPVVLEQFASSQKFDGLMVLGCIIRGETSHYEHIAQSTTDQIAQISVKHEIPVGFGLLTVETLEQAMNRAGGKFGNKGKESAETVLEMTNLMGQLTSFKKNDLLRQQVETWERVSEKK